MPNLLEKLGKATILGVLLSSAAYGYSMRNEQDPKILARRGEIVLNLVMPVYAALLATAFGTGIYFSRKEVSKNAPKRI